MAQGYSVRYLICHLGEEIQQGEAYVLAESEWQAADITRTFLTRVWCTSNIDIVKVSPLMPAIEVKNDPEPVGADRPIRVSNMVGDEAVAEWLGQL